MSLRIVSLTILAAVVGLAVNGAFAQSYPSRTIRIVTSDAGGGSDIVTRIIAQGTSGPLGQPVIVENRPGGVIAGETVAKAPPDGYTLLFYGSTLWLLPLMRKSVPYDALRDFAPITLTSTAPAIVTVHPSLPVKSVKDLIALAKAHPGQLNYGSSAVGTFNHLSTELFKSMAHVDIVRIGYKGGGALLNDLIAGQIQLAFSVISSTIPHVKSGRLRALAITSAQRSAQLPELPTVAATGLPGYESLSLNAMFAPAKTPDAIINRLNQEILVFFRKPEVKARFLEIGVEAPGSTPAQLTQTLKTEIDKWGKLFRETGIRDE